MVNSEDVGRTVLQSVQLTLEFLWVWAQVWWLTLVEVFRVIVPPQPRDVAGEVVLITGAGHGMGREMALRFGREGATVVCVDINMQNNQDTVKTIKESGGHAQAFQCDVTDKAAVTALVEQVRSAVGDVSILVNNAGIMPCRPLLSHTEKEIRSVVDINLMGNLWMIQGFLPAMIERNHGHIVAMSSMAGLGGHPNLVPYSATKFGVRGIMESLGEELADIKYKDTTGIKLTTVYPFIVNTGLARRPRIRFSKAMPLVEAADAAAVIVDAVRRGYREVTVPPSMYYQFKFLRVFPHNALRILNNFVGVSLEAHD